MKKNLLSLSFLLFSISSFSQTTPDYVTVDTDTYTTQQLVTGVLINSPSVNISNISSTAACGLGYFNRNNSDFPFKDGMIIRSGNAASSQGKFSNSNTGSVCSNATDEDLRAINLANGGEGL